MYIIVIKHNHHFFVQGGWKDENAGIVAISRVTTIEEGIDRFSDFVEAIESESKEDKCASGLALSLLSPTLVLWNDTDIPQIEKHTVHLDKVRTQLNGVVYKLICPMIEVRETIFEGRETVNIANHIIMNMYKKQGFTFVDENKND